MTQHEILGYALKGICFSMNKEEEIAKRVKEQYGHDDAIANARIEKLQKKFHEVMELMRELEQQEA